MSFLKVEDNEVLEGLALTRLDELALDGNMVISRALDQAARVTIVTMSASGSEPSLCGFVGAGQADIAVVGNVEAAPGPASVLKAVQLADKGKGVLLIVLNNAGDILTSNIVMAHAAKLGISISRVIIKDEIIAAEAEPELRQGLVGAVPVLQIAAAAAAQGQSLAEVSDLAESLARNEASAMVALQAVQQDWTAAAVAELVIPQLQQALQLKPQEQVLLLVNGNGVASVREQLAVYRSCYAGFLAREIKVAAGAADDYFTGQRDVFIQVCAVKVNEEQAQLWRAR